MDYLIHLATLASIYAIAVLGLNYASGFTGLISLSHGAFMGIGAYSFAIALTSYAFPYPVALFLAGVITALTAFVLSFPLLRLKGDAFVLVSFGFAFIAFSIFLNWDSLTNGALGIKGIPQPEIFFFENPRIALLFLVLAVLGFSMLFLWTILRSSYGVILRATRENLKVTQMAGHHTESYRRSVFVVSGCITGFAGAFLASFISAIDPTLFGYHLSILLLIMTIFGGLACLKGSVIGAASLILLPEALRFIGLPHGILAESQQILYGLTLILLMMYRPRGLFGAYSL